MTEAIDRTTRLKQSPDITLQDLGAAEGGVVLNLVSGEMYTLNETGLAFVQRIDGNASIAAIAGEMVREFDVEEEALTRDLVDIARELGAEGIVSAS